MQANLHVDGTKQDLLLRGPGPWVIGRREGADLRIDASGCSREQARIVRTADGYAVEDLSAFVATTLDGNLIVGLAPLRDGARIDFAHHRVVFQLVEGLPSGTASERGSVNIKVTFERSFTVGRVPMEDQVLLEDASVSRQHAAFQVFGNGVVVRDLGSTNGTYVNDVRIDKPHVLAPGDRVDIGPFRIVFPGPTEI
jgi:pSer/pThr/pTyr-binding forkhead associated (FHA) protein